MSVLTSSGHQTILCPTQHTAFTNCVVDPDPILSELAREILSGFLYSNLLRRVNKGAINIVLENMEDTTFGDDDFLSEEEPITAQKVLQTLEEAWLNEKFSPELLASQADYVECMMEQIQQMEDNLNKLKKSDFRVEVHHMELARIRYIITSYLRTRLEKIEQNTVHILEQEAERGPENPHLSEDELAYAKNFLSLQENHFKQLVLKHVPPPVQDFMSTQKSLVPNLRSHVFLRAKKDIEGVVTEGDGENRDEDLDLEENSQHIMQYKPIATLLKDGAVQLI